MECSALSQKNLPVVFEEAVKAVFAKQKGGKTVAAPAAKPAGKKPEEKKPGGSHTSATPAAGTSSGTSSGSSGDKDEKCSVQ
jgi:hypothetical protein